MVDDIFFFRILVCSGSRYHWKDEGRGLLKTEQFIRTFVSPTAAEVPEHFITGVSVKD